MDRRALLLGLFDGFSCASCTRIPSGASGGVSRMRLRRSPTAATSRTSARTASSSPSLAGWRSRIPTFSIRFLTSMNRTEHSRRGRRSRLRGRPRSSFGPPSRGAREGRSRFRRGRQRVTQPCGGHRASARRSDAFGALARRSREDRENARSPALGRAPERLQVMGCRREFRWLARVVMLACDAATKS